MICFQKIKYSNYSGKIYDENNIKILVMDWSYGSIKKNFNITLYVIFQSTH